MNAGATTGTSALNLGTLRQFGDHPALDLGAIGEKLLAELSPTVHAANRTLLVTEHFSFHMFATNRTEFCHYHPGDTLQRVLHGGGQFYVDYGKPVPQNPGDSFFIPKGKPHAFDGQLHGPSLVLVQWSPPYHDGYIIPTSGCRF
ncbi:hypothetical protein PTSG_00204 [Salpingoeca rosetta]|uniref:Cupin type-2 domain-containing protein n=1 Tax=Salpingoeca rosetta (strain ATCC 50818 / BSB-021) TaxID=946362 RepID=F2TVT5_SALR5|nr:uncharacterized protein PTSG_00204 [Salpingoeca rosetta]EGD72181.1 hypothetical protein PTSG_00204 [Salpingoeca rosetta]|eukprot:XP_004998753.1 hypothetical protein PTSG_00204 [Salpingoeca rosetta]